MSTLSRIFEGKLSHWGKFGKRQHVVFAVIPTGVALNEDDVVKVRLQTVPQHCECGKPKVKGERK